MSSQAENSLRRSGEPSPEDLVDEFTLAISELGKELAIATEAIAAARLEDFRASVLRQQLLCTALTAASDRIRRMREEGDSLAAGKLTPLRAAQLDVLCGIRNYGVLLERADRLAKRRGVLCDSYTGHYPHRSIAPGRRSDWFCEA